MPQSLRSILGGSNRVRKPSQPKRPGVSSPSPRKRSSASSPGTSAQAPKEPRRKTKRERDEELFAERLEDRGAVSLMLEELTLRDVVQTMRYIQRHMFSVVPATGFHSSRTTELLNHRRAFPKLVTVGHLHAVLSSPTMVEREVAELLAKGVVRKVRVERRGGFGEALIETPDLEAMLDAATEVSEETRVRFKCALKENPTAQTLPGDALTETQADELIRAGFLTSSARVLLGTTLDVRPEDRTTLTSIQHVSQFASGSVSAVGGRNAIHLAGGSGSGSGRLSITPATRGRGGAGAAATLRLAVPGHGRYLKIASGVVEWVREALGRTKWGEGTETWLQERFEGGGLYGTRWKEFWGIEWKWVVGEAAGVGAVELFDTGSVGRGVRALA